MMEGCYWDYIRVYVPQGSTLLSRSHPSGPNPEEVLPGKAVFSGYLVIPPGGREEVSFRYRLPSGALAHSGLYRLRLDKQPGISAFPVEMSFGLPAGWRMAQVKGDLPLEETGGKWQFQLSRDQAIEVRFARGHQLSPLRWVLIGLGVAAGFLILVVGVRLRKWG